MFVKKFNLRNRSHVDRIIVILMNAARFELPWQQIVTNVKKEFEVTNWIHVRRVLQALINQGFVKRTDDVHNEVYVINKK